MAGKTVKVIQTIAAELLFHGEKHDVVESMEALASRVEEMVSGANELLNQVQAHSARGRRAKARPVPAAHARVASFLERSLRDTVEAFDAVVKIPNRDVVRVFVHHAKVLNEFAGEASQVIQAFQVNVLPIAQQWMGELPRSRTDNRRLVVLEKVLQSRAQSLQEPIGRLKGVGEALCRAAKAGGDEGEGAPPSVSWLSLVRLDQWIAWGAFRFVHDTLLGWVFPTMAQAFLGLLLAVSDAKGMSRVATVHSMLKTTLLLSARRNAQKVPSVTTKDSPGWLVFEQTCSASGVLHAARASGLAFVHKLMFALDPEGSDHYAAVEHLRAESGVRGSAFTMEEVSRDVEGSAYAAAATWFTRGWLFRALSRFHPSTLVQTVVSFITPGEREGLLHRVAERAARLVGVHDALTTIVTAVLLPVLFVIGFKAIVWSTSALQSAFRFLTGVNQEPGPGGAARGAQSSSDRELVGSLKRSAKPLATVRDAIWG